MRQPRLLFYAVNGLGLGHVTRLLGIARAVRERAPGAEILFVTASEASHLIFREGFAALKVPSRTAARQGRLRRDTFMRLTQSTVWNAMTAFDPHCLVVDTFAAGALQELLPLLRWPLRKVFVYRVQRTERASDPFFQSTLRLYDLILVPHDAGSEHVPTPPEVATKWTGPMVLRPRRDLLCRRDARLALNLPLEGEIGLLSLGGGGDPEIVAARGLFEQALKKTRSSPVSSPALWIEAAGPLEVANPTETAEAVNGDVASGDLVSQHVAHSETSANIRQMREVHPLLLYLNAFDYAVCSAGYNTVHELHTARLPAALWPFARDIDDQGARVRELARLGRVLQIGEGALDATGALNRARVDELSQALRALQEPATRRRLGQAMEAVPEFAGATRGAAAILRCLGIED